MSAAFDSLIAYVRATPLGRMIMRERPPTFAEYARKVRQ